MFLNAYYNRDEQEIHIWDDKKGHVKFKYKQYAYLKIKPGTTTSTYSIYGDAVKKVYRWTKQDEVDGNVFESDVPVLTRVLVDIYSNSDEASNAHKLVILDIEVATSGGFPNIMDADNEIISIALFDKVANQYTVLVLDTQGLYKPIKRDNIEVKFFSTEEELLNTFFLKWTEIQPTIVSGWNIEKFDIPYLYHRARKVCGHEIASALSPIAKVLWNEYKEQYKIAGISVLDYLGLYKKFTYTQESSYSLDSIGLKEVNTGKTKYEGTLDNLFKTDINKFIEYNLNDVQIVTKIDDKMKLIDLVKYLCHKAHCPYEDVYYSSRVIDGAILTYLKKLGIIAPNKKFKTMDDAIADGVESFSGAFVKEPIPGRYFWVYDLDMTSLYPSVIMSLNISPETKIGKIDGWDSEEYVKNVPQTYTIRLNDRSPKKMSTEELKEWLEQHKYSIAINGVIYKKKDGGLIPTILDTWFSERVEYRSLMKKYGHENDKEKYEYFKHLQHVMKILLNSVYGVLGLPTFRFYDADNAEAVTTTGVKIIQFAERMVNKFYAKELGKEEDYCIYIDTDSTFFSSEPIIKNRFPNADFTNVEFMSKETLKIASEVQIFLNKAFDLFALRFLNIEDHRFDIKQEVVAKSALWIAKKRYAHWIINDNGVPVDKLEVKGLDSIRSNFSKAFRNFMKEILTDILKNVDKKIIDDKILTFKEALSKLNIQDIAKPTSVKGILKYTARGSANTLMGRSMSIFKESIKGAPVHVKATINYNNFLRYLGLEKTHEQLYEGEKIRWAYMRPNELGVDEMAFRGTSDPKEILDFIRTNIDTTKIFEHELQGKIRDFYDALKWTFPSVSEKKMAEFFEF